LDKSIYCFNFEILLRDKFPFQPPLITTRTKVIKKILIWLVLHALPGGRKGPVASYHSKEGGGLAAIDDLDRYYLANPCLYY
jgi:hypothetical protein